jgi:hypothetical protein
MAWRACADVCACVGGGGGAAAAARSRGRGIGAAARAATGPLTGSGAAEPGARSPSHGAQRATLGGARVLRRGRRLAAPVPPGPADRPAWVTELATGRAQHPLWSLLRGGPCGVVAVRVRACVRSYAAEWVARIQLVQLLTQLGGLPGGGQRQRSSVLGMLGLRQLWRCRGTSGRCLLREATNTPALRVALRSPGVGGASIACTCALPIVRQRRLTAAAAAVAAAYSYVAVCRAFRAWSNTALAELPLIMVVGGLKTAAAPAPAPAYGALAASPRFGHEADSAGAMLEAGQCRPWLFIWHIHAPTSSAVERWSDMCLAPPTLSPHVPPPPWPRGRLAHAAEVESFALDLATLGWRTLPPGAATVRATPHRPHQCLPAYPAPPPTPSWPLQRRNVRVARNRSQGAAMAPLFAYGGLKLVDGMLIVATSSGSTTEPSFVAPEPVDAASPDAAANWPPWLSRASVKRRSPPAPPSFILHPSPKLAWDSRTGFQLFAPVTRCCRHGPFLALLACMPWQAFAPLCAVSAGRVLVIGGAAGVLVVGGA